MMENLDTILSVAGVGTMAIKSFFLYFFNLNTLMNDYVKGRVDELMKENPSVKYQDASKEFLTWVINEEYSPFSIFSPENEKYNRELDSLKKKILKFYFSKLQELGEDNSEYTYSCDIHNELSQLVLQLLRLRLIIKPEVQISQNVHPVTNHAYLAAKSFWLDDKGEKVRKFTKSLGLASEYKGGRKDREALKKGTILIQEVIYTLYKETYPE